MVKRHPYDEAIKSGRRPTHASSSAHVNNNNNTSSIRHHQRPLQPSTIETTKNHEPVLPRSSATSSEAAAEDNPNPPQARRRTERRPLPAGISLVGADVGGRFRIRGTEPIGKGSGGEVWQCDDLRTGKRVALKRLRSRAIKERARETALTLDKELGRNPRLVAPLLQVADDRFAGYSFVACELQESGDLRSKLLEEGPLSVARARTALADLLMALHFLHDRAIVHRDVKPENLFLGPDGMLRLGDFGLSTDWKEGKALTPQMVTLWYRAPEILLGSKMYSTKVDVFSAGCVMVELLTARPVFKGSTVLQQLAHIFEHLGFPDPESWPEMASALQGLNRPRSPASAQTGQLPSTTPDAPSSTPSPSSPPCQEDTINGVREMLPFGTSDNLVDLIRQMLRVNPADRITAAQALRHPFFWDEPSVAAWCNEVEEASVVIHTPRPAAAAAAEACSSVQLARRSQEEGEGGKESAPGTTQHESEPADQEQFSRVSPPPSSSSPSPHPHDKTPVGGKDGEEEDDMDYSLLLREFGHIPSGFKNHRPLEDMYVLPNAAPKRRRRF